MNTYLERLRSERESLSALSTGIAERAAAEDRDVSEAEETQVREAGVRVAVLDRQIEEFGTQLAAQNRYRQTIAAAEQAIAENDVPAAPAVAERAETGLVRSFGAEFVERGLPANWTGHGTARLELDRSLLERATITNANTANPATNVGVFELPERPTGASSVMGRGTVGTDTIHYVVASTPVAGASVVAEGTAKPEAVFTLAPATAPVVTIAWWVPVTRQALQDTSYLSTLIDGQLRRGVLRRLNYEIVNGDGTGGDMTGLVTAAGTLPISGPPEPATILNAIAAVEAVGYFPNAIIANPATIGKLAAATSTAGGYLADATGALQRVTGAFGVPFVPDVGVPADTAYVSDFSTSCTLWDRMQTAVFTGEQHADNFVKNILVVLAEGRWGFTIQEPGAIAEVTLTATP